MSGGEAIVIPRWHDYTRVATIDPRTRTHAIRRRSLRRVVEEAVDFAPGQYDVLGGHFLALTRPRGVPPGAPWREIGTLWIDADAHPTARVEATVRGVAFGGIGARRLTLEVDGRVALSTWYVPGRVLQRLVGALLAPIDFARWPEEESDRDLGVLLAQLLPPRQLSGTIAATS